MKQIIIVVGVVIAGLVLSQLVLRIDQSAPKESSGQIQNKKSSAKSVDSQNVNYPRYKEIVNPSGFVNIDSITIGELIGKKVVLVDFMTYSCINCIRTFPYLVRWYDKYKDDGLEIVGIHTPEFAFEKKIMNVEAAMKEHNITYPVVLDNDYETWKVYGNRYWPRKYLIDIDGNVVYDHIGEGAYDTTERKIQELLKQRAERLGMGEEIENDLTYPEDAEKVDRLLVRSPETYFGTLRQNYLGYNIMPNGEVTSFPNPASIKPNTLHLVGGWILTGEYAESADNEVEIIFKYRSKKVFLVASSEEPVRARIFVDGEPVSNLIKGVDVDDEGYVIFQKEALYRLIENSPSGEHVLEIIVEKPGLRAFAFTFG